MKDKKVVVLKPLLIKNYVTTLQFAALREKEQKCNDGGYMWVG